MLAAIARFILRNRIIFALFLLVLSGFMTYKATRIKVVYEFARLLPESDSASIAYQNFKDKFGLDGNVLLLSTIDDKIFQLDHFQAWYQLSQRMKELPGIQEVVSISRLYNLIRNDSLQKFQFNPIITHCPQSQIEVDSIKQVIQHLPFYDGFIYNAKNEATVIAITFKRGDIDSKLRVQVTDSIRSLGNAYGNKFNLKMHYSGLPYIRSTLQRLVSSEMIMFLILALLVTMAILFLFFRNPYVLICSFLVVLIGVLCSFGTLAIFGFKITILTGLIPPLLIVIGVPNCILLLNKYHVEYARHQNQGLALMTMFQKISVSLFFANLTTAIGFAVFCFTQTRILYEFGLTASINVMTTYIISLLVIPVVFSYLPPPPVKHTKHLRRPKLSSLLLKIDTLVQTQRTLVYGIAVGLVIISALGIAQMKILGYVIDDLPKNDPIYQDMHYFESNFHGVLPFEIVIDTKREKGVFADNGRILYKINTLQKMLGQYPAFSKPVSVVEGIKYSYQSYKGGNQKYFRLPGAIELGEISNYASEAREKQNTFKAFIDSTRRYTRISVQMADIGSVEMKHLAQTLKPRMDSIFNYDKETNTWLEAEKKCNIDITGFSMMFLKGNDFLVENLMESVVLAVVLIALVMSFLFFNWRMVIIAVVPSLVPLLITAGIMGFFNIHLKPSTILIFSIAFGISSDGTLYFLTKYRQEKKKTNESISKIVSKTIKETGISMIYTAIVLASGFGIFTASKFGGTAALGLLVSITLLLSYCSNLILLPSFLLSFERGNEKRLKKRIEKQKVMSFKTDS